MIHDLTLKYKEPTAYETETVAESQREFSEMQLWRATFASQWEEVAAVIATNYVNTFYYGSYNWPGQKKTAQQVDATGMMALNRFGAIMDSLLTPRNMIWHQLGSENEYVMKNRDARLWYEQATRKLFQVRYAPIANFASQNYQNYQMLGAFGTAGMFIDQAFDPVGNPLKALRYRAIPLGELFIKENHQGIVDGFVRWFRLTARQAKQKWPDTFPAALQSALEQGSQQPFNFIHRVCPRCDWQPGRLDAKGKIFASYYISLEGNCLLSEGGYTSFPLPISRYEQAPGEVYGRSPAMMVLPALKTLNAQKATYLKVGHRVADPVLLTADDGIIDMSLRPGSVNKGGVTADGRPLVHTLPTGDLQHNIEMMDREASLINDAFLVSLFQILMEKNTMTATEVIERVNEKGILLAPTVGRQQSEYLGPMIDRELDLMSSLGMLPPMPPIIREARGDYHVVYTSPLSRAQRAQEVAGFARTVETVLTLVNATQDPSLLDPFDFDKAIPDIASIQAVPESWMADPKAIAQKRQNRAQAAQQQAQIQAMPAQAAMIKAHAVAAKAQSEGAIPAHPNMASGFQGGATGAPQPQVQQQGGPPQ